MRMWLSPGFWIFHKFGFYWIVRGRDMWQVGRPLGQVFNGRIVIAGDAVLTAVVMNRNSVCSKYKKERGGGGEDGFEKEAGR